MTLRDLGFTPVEERLNRWRLWAAGIAFVATEQEDGRWSLYWWANENVLPVGSAGFATEEACAVAVATLLLTNGSANFDKL